MQPATHPGREVHLLRAVVHGWVQGVGYRDFVAREAGRLGLRGYVRNVSDGTVEVEAEGPRGDVERFLDLLRQGPPMAEVREVDHSLERGGGNFSRFELRW
ncbi:MAG TPA: acylphosphatase [Candidatus Dormibacteraeota bacterium]|nr:acylphosphatase [Candidatus Dormibacteraeota bacterium]